MAEMQRAWWFSTFWRLYWSEATITDNTNYQLTCWLA